MLTIFSSCAICLTIRENGKSTAWRGPAFPTTLSERKRVPSSVVPSSARTSRPPSLSRDQRDPHQKDGRRERRRKTPENMFPLTNAERLPNIGRTVTEGSSGRIDLKNTSSFLSAPGISIVSTTEKMVKKGFPISYSNIPLREGKDAFWVWYYRNRYTTIMKLNVSSRCFFLARWKLRCQFDQTGPNLSKTGNKQDSFSFL